MKRRRVHAAIATAEPSTPLSVLEAPQLAHSARPTASTRRIQPLVVAPTPFFGDYGCHVRILEEVRALQALGLRPVLCTYPYGRNVDGITTLRSAGLPRRSEVRPGSSLHKLYLDALLSLRVSQAALARRPDVLHGHLHEGAFVGLAVGLPLRLPVVFDFQGSLTSEMVDHGFLRPGGTRFRFFRLLEATINRGAGWIITSTAHGAALLRSEFGCPAGRITVVPDRVNTNVFRPLWLADDPARAARVRALRNELGIPRDRKVVVYLGLLAAYQGIGHLLRAAVQVVRRYPDVHFLIMGYPGHEDYRAHAAALGLGEHVTFTGRVPYEQAPLYLALGDVAVAPKVSETEGNGKLLNYMAMGLPTVVFDTPVNREILGDLGVYARLGDVDELADQLVAVLRDDAGAAWLGQMLRRQAVRRHSWLDAAEQILDVYERLTR